MTTISQTFEKLRQEKQCALIPFITAGDPDLETTAKALEILDRSGADLIELGVPYSDPLADGPVIHGAATRALKQGIRLEQVLDVVQTVSPSLQAPIILFTYYNPIFSRGIPAFIEQIARAGVKGIIVPDLPLEESSELIDAAAEKEIEVTLLIAPTSSPDRIKAIAAQSRGFIYLVSVTGVTGIRSEAQIRVKDLIPQVRQISDRPIGVGFGISSVEQARQVKEWGADAIIVGSAFVQRLGTNPPTKGLAEIENLAQTLKSALCAAPKESTVSV